MRRSIVAGNWKMNMTHIEGASLARDIASAVGKRGAERTVIIFPPYTTIPAVVDAVKDSVVIVGGQDMYHKDRGAFTGEISGEMLKTAGCDYVIVGHSERRHIMGEGGEILSKKLKATFRNGIDPVFCLGEVLEERERGNASDVVAMQIKEVLDGLEFNEMKRVVLAYEPVWAIGTGKTATPGDADEMHGIIRGILEDTFDTEIAECTEILYGGSVKPGNAAEIMKKENVDGVLVGGASLDASSFEEIIFAE